MSRIAHVQRTTSETSVDLTLDLDGTGQLDISTGVPFFDHVLSALAKHASFDLSIHTLGDLDVDSHHTVEDTALALGEALATALGDKSGITRFGDALVPLDEALVSAALDLSGRPYLSYSAPPLPGLIGSFPTSLLHHVWRSFSSSASLTLHLRVLSGEDAHHIAEAQFKAVARALATAVHQGPHRGIPSTKGVL